jgi:hypothetical protein
MRRGSLWIALVVLCVMGIAACGGNSHHVTPPLLTNNFVFYAAGEDNLGNTYSIVGAINVTADGNNTITGGEQDFNDGDTEGLGTSPQPGGDQISGAGSSLVFSTDGSGNAVLTLATSNLALGPAATPGVETFALSFANGDHAIISQFDGSAVSSGSYDLQKLPGAPLAPTAFSIITSGADPEALPIAEGGVIQLDGSGNVTGSVDINDGGALLFAQSPTEGTVLSAIDSFGRGAVSGSLDGTTELVNFYVVNSEVLRLIDVDTDHTAVGSAYGQGVDPNGDPNTFTTASIGQSAFMISGVNMLVPYAGAGQFSNLAGTPDAKPRTASRVHPQGQPTVCAGGTCFINGIADVNESLIEGPDDIVFAQPFDATVTMLATGYGSFVFDPGPTSDIAQFGVYAVDPNLNILDPNATVDPAQPAGVGAALIAEMDDNLVGTGLLTPQTDATLSDIAPTVVFNAQGNGLFASDSDEFLGEFDLLGTSSVVGVAAVPADPTAMPPTPAIAATATFTGAGFIDDPAGILTDDGGPLLDGPLSSFTATFTDDGSGFGRSTSGTGGFNATSSTSVTALFTVTAYEANANQFFWVETDLNQTFTGTIQSVTAPVDAARPKNK